MVCRKIRKIPLHVAYQKRCGRKAGVLVSKFNFIETEIDGVYIIEPTAFDDNFGYFIEIYL